MNNEFSSRQLQLFPGERIAWETLPEDCQQSVQQLLSLLLEQVHSQQHQQTQSTTQLAETNQHV